jgi:hypothetical protein
MGNPLGWHKLLTQARIASSTAKALEDMKNPINTHVYMQVLADDVENIPGYVYLDLGDVPRKIDMETNHIQPPLTDEQMPMRDVIMTAAKSIFKSGLSTTLRIFRPDEGDLVHAISVDNMFTGSSVSTLAYPVNRTIVND